MIARDGWTFILIGLVLTIIFIWMATRWDSRTAFVFSLIFAFLTTFTAYFFRDPDRSATIQPGMLLAPADGKIVMIDTLDNHPFVGDKAIQVSIFLSVFDVHINRVPAGGLIDYVNYNPGEFFAAYEDKASLLNEQTEIGMITETGAKIAFKQIAGLIARRIVCDLVAGDRVIAGDRFGLIRFGSRTDILLPANSQVAVKLGDRVRGGETVIGQLAPLATEPDTHESDDETNARL